MRSTKKNSWLGIAFLLGVLVVAQNSALAHLGVDDSHPADEACAFCVSLADFSAGNVSSQIALDACAQPSSSSSLISDLWYEHRFAPQLARGPPTAS